MLWYILQDLCSIEINIRSPLLSCIIYISELFNIPMQGVQLSSAEFMKKNPLPRQQTDVFAAVNSGSLPVRQSNSPPVGSPVKHLTSCALPVGNKIIIWSVILVECSIQARGTDRKWVNPAT